MYDTTLMYQYMLNNFTYFCINLVPKIFEYLIKYMVYILKGESERNH